LGRSALCKAGTQVPRSAGFTATSGVRTRTGDLRIMRPEIESPKSHSDKTLRSASSPLAHHLPTDKRKTPRELQSIIDAWSNLPDPIRAAIMALVNAASGNGGGR